MPEVESKGEGKRLEPISGDWTTTLTATAVFKRVNQNCTKTEPMARSIEVPSIRQIPHLPGNNRFTKGLHTGGFALLPSPSKDPNEQIAEDYEKYPDGRGEKALFRETI